MGRSLNVARYFRYVGSCCMVRNKKLILLSIFHEEDLGFSDTVLSKAESFLRANEIVSPSSNCMIVMDLVLCLDP